MDISALIFPLAFIWVEDSLDTCGEIHSLLTSSFQKYLLKSCNVLSSAVSWHMVGNKKQRVPAYGDNILVGEDMK